MSATSNKDTSSKELSPREEKKALKRQRIIEAALAVFSELGYEGASLDEIAKRAEVSKPTLYQYFGNKEKLFSSVLEETASKIIAPLSLSEPEQSMVATLVNFSHSYANIVLAPDVLSMGRLIIGVVERFPKIGQDYYKSGPQKVLESMTEYFAKKGEEGRLELTDPELAAQDFWSLILSEPREICQYFPHKKFSSQELDKFIFNGLRVFLKAYSTQVDEDIKELEQLKKQLKG